MATVARRCTPQVVAACLTIMLGCQVRGVIGSNLGPSIESDDDGNDDDGDDDVVVTDGSVSTGVAGETSAGADGADDAVDVKFDVGIPDAPAICPMPAQIACDVDSDDPWRAMGLNCLGFGPQVEGSIAGNPQSLHVQHGTLGTDGYFEPREGQRTVILSTGIASEIPLPRTEPCPSCPSTDFAQPMIPILPAPVDVRRVDARHTCTDDPTLIGMGDCSNTLEAEWIAGDGAYDYVEMRISAEVPEPYDSFRYQFAFFSAEYPLWTNHQSQWNDMYVAWLQSESWTGNVSFDEAGHPISINGVFMDFRDAPSTECPEPCEAPELDGFAMEGHAGTRWLETTAPVVAGETIELVFAIFDLTDGAFDSAVMLDDWDWICSGGPPVTTPVG